MKTNIILVVVLSLIAFTSISKDVQIKKKGGKKDGCGGVTYNYTFYSENDDLIKITCTGRGPNSCFGYSAVQNSNGCNEPSPTFDFQINPCIIEELVINYIDAGFSEKKGIYGQSIYWSYENGFYDSEQETYSYDLIISDQPLW